MTYEITSSSYEETLRKAAEIGARLRGGEAIELVADVGGGKTAFVTGLASGAQSTDKVSSPSFTINHIYRTPYGFINHYDLYRLQDPGIMKHELEEAAGDTSSTLVIEWGKSVQDILPKDRVVVHLIALEADVRKITITVSPKYRYLYKGLIT